MYINNRLQFSEIHYSCYNTSNKDLESQWVSIYQNPNKTILIGNLYRPPKGDSGKCLELIDDILSDIDLQRIEVILIGHLNLDILDKNNADAKQLINMAKQLGLRQLIKEPTRYSPYKDSCLDLIFTNSNIIARAGVGNVNMSDHQIIIMTRKKAKTTKQKCEFIGRSYRNYNKVDFQEQIRLADWEFLDENLTIDDQWDRFQQNISTIIDEMCPKKVFKIKQIKQPWITPRLLELILDKDRVLKNAKKSRNKDLWLEAKRLRNACTNRLRKAKADYVRDQLEMNANDQKKFWKHIQQIVPNSSKGKQTITLKDLKDNTQIDADNQRTILTISL